MKEIDYNELYQEVRELLMQMNEIVLATSYKDRVTARTVYCICDNLDIYFITSKAYIKYKQILKNPNVALSKDQLQIEGVVEDLGHPRDDENAFFETICKNHEGYDAYFKRYSKYKNSVLLKVKPSLITMYKSKGAFEYLNLQKQIAERKG